MAVFGGSAACLPYLNYLKNLGFGGLEIWRLRVLVLEDGGGGGSGSGR